MYVNYTSMFKKDLSVNAQALRGWGWGVLQRPLWVNRLWFVASILVWVERMDSWQRGAGTLSKQPEQKGEDLPGRCRNGSWCPRAGSAGLKAWKQEGKVVWNQGRLSPSLLPVSAPCSSARQLGSTALSIYVRTLMTAREGSTPEELHTS